MSSCSSCSSASSCKSATSNGGDGKCNDPMALQDQLIASTLEKIRHKIFVMSGKGGVGKSSVTVNTAAALARRGFKVGVLDVDMHGPSVPNLLGLTSTVEMDEDGRQMLPAAYNENLSVISMDSLLQDKDQAILWRGPKKSSAIRQFIADVKWGELDFLLIDSPPGTGDEHMTVLKSIPDALWRRGHHAAGNFLGRCAQGCEFSTICQRQCFGRGRKYERRSVLTAGRK